MRSTAIRCEVISPRPLRNLPLVNLLKGFLIFWLLFHAPCIFAAIPINERALSGMGAAEARLKLLSAAESYLGTPYRYAGLDRRGLDCSGLVYLSFRDGLKYTIPRTSEGIYNWAEKIETSELQIGDMVFFVTVGSAVSHLGIYAGGGRFIHAASEGPSTGVIYSRLDEAYWRRTYKGAGRALPWDDAAAEAMAAALNAAQGSQPSAYAAPAGYAEPAARAWAESGLFAGFGAAFTFGGLFDGSSSVFRGLSTTAAIGYKWVKYRAGLELRPELDRAMGVFRLPITLSVGTDIIQVFAGPAYTFGEPYLNLHDGDRYYKGGWYWLGELGVSAAIPPLRIGAGALSFYGELAWQPYLWEDWEEFSFKPDLTANFRLSTGLRYLWRLGM